MSQLPVAKYLKDYQLPDYWIEQTDLEFDLSEQDALVQAQLTLSPRKPDQLKPLILDGELLELVSVAINHQQLTAEQYQQTEHQLILPAQSGPVVLTLVTRIYPAKNTALTGLYQSSGNFCSQCEAEGFRRITYYLDRPDVLSRFSCLIRADKRRYPWLLSNGNPVESGDLADGRHYVKWQDPFPKPCYLFALVAGQFELREDRFMTMSGREIKLQLFVQPGFLAQTQYAMASLQRAMAWDEREFGLEYDLDIYMIVAVDDFNMGAMENKGLNIFNTRYVLADATTATDDDHLAVEAVIAHEYFHNWTGNRVTCRNWFQLSLKEGLTVFRDQLFTASLHGYAVKRIDDVNQLRSRQFAEDAGPMAHPVRPESYIEMNNFYTLTVYEKGAEVIRMLHSLLGEKLFRCGMDLYFARHDGNAVTCEDFIVAMEQASGRDLAQFRLWYSQAGTPKVQAEGYFDAATRRYRLRLRQSCPATPGQTSKMPMLIPIKMALFSDEAQQLPLLVNGATTETKELLLELTQSEQEWWFESIDNPPIPSLLRDFSAPIRLDYPYENAELAFLFAVDNNQFNRWEAGQRLASKLCLAAVADNSQPDASAFIEAVERLLREPQLDASFQAEAISLPSELYLADQSAVVDTVGIHRVRQSLRLQLAEALEPILLARYHELRMSEYSLEPMAMAQRALANQLLDYLLAFSDGRYLHLASHQYWQADNMTDRLAALRLVAHIDCTERPTLLADFAQRYGNQPLVMDKWFSLQASSSLTGTLAQVIALTQHSAFSLNNPNKVRALIGAFAMNNPLHFHAPDGSGYRWLGQQVLLLDAINPQIAARMLLAFTGWPRQKETQQRLIKAELGQLLAAAHLSKDSFEIVSKSLQVV